MQVKTIIYTLESDGKIVKWDTSKRLPLISDTSRTKETTNRILASLSEFHADQPLLNGQNASQLCRDLEIDELAFEKITDRLIKSKDIAKDGNLLRLSSHEIQFSEEESNTKEILEKIYYDAGINAPSLNELSTLLPDITPQLIESTFYALMNLGQIIKTYDNLYIHKEIFDELKRILIEFLRENETISVAEFRELAGTTRKYAVPFLEYCDTENVTVRDGNVRKLSAKQEK